MNEEKYLDCGVAVGSDRRFGREARPGQPDTTELTLEQLMNVEITTVSKKEELLFTAPAAAYVITGEQIRRSGVRSIPKALRTAPGVEVAQIGDNE